MDEHSGESKEEELMGEGIGEQEIEELVYHNEVDEEIKGAELCLRLGALEVTGNGTVKQITYGSLSVTVSQ